MSPRYVAQKGQQLCTDNRPPEFGSSWRVIDRRSFLSLTVSTGAMRLIGPELASAEMGSAGELAKMTLAQAGKLVRDGEVSPVDLTKACLARIEDYDATINAFITVTSDHALEQARAAEVEIQRGRWRGALHGIPIALKDNIDTAGIRTTEGRLDLVDRIPRQDAEVVRRLKQAGAVILGKLNLGMGAEGHWGAVHNPWSLEYECGYSSSGPGGAVAADFCFGALGTDGAGSVRIPASACGVVGLMATRGLVSGRGVTENPMSNVGPLTKTVLDAGLLLEAIAGYDPEWPDSVMLKLPEFASTIGPAREPFRFAIPDGGFYDDLDPDVEQLVSGALQTMREIGTFAEKKIEVPSYWEVLEGTVRKRFLSTLDKVSNDYQPFLGRRLASTPRQSVGDLPFVDPDPALQQARAAAAGIFGENVDLLVLPTWKRAPMAIAKRGWPLPREEFMRELWNTLPFNVLGLPAISVPCGFTKENLPVGLQIVGKPFCETQVLAFAHAYERATSWHSSKPPF